MDFGNRIKKEREKKEMLLREVAAFVNMDPALLSKIERGKRKATREQVKAFSKLFKLNQKELITLWLGEKIAYSIIEEETPIEILKIAENTIQYLKRAF